ncbi:pentatricopeptide repeat-containing protein At3g14330 isoform X1 [Euphorbia lathyris]|uniref:pentatricopeptide repeat-containing protein At3g14330 isoform X1 n=1 Tax=Euphorbia lathyris TaxID=212925 RepID=UPI003313A9F3
MIPAISLLTNKTRPIEATAISSNQIPKPQKLHLNQTLKSLSKSGKLEEAIRLIESSPPNFIYPDSYATLLHSCISHKSLDHGKRIYQKLLHENQQGHNLIQHPTLKSKLITLFSICGRLQEARRIFEEGLQIDAGIESVWVAMAIGYSKHQCFREAMLVYIQMLWHYILPGNYSFSVALKSCINLNDSRLGRGVHGQVVKSSEEADQVVNNALLSFYAQCGCFSEVLKMFDEMPQRNIVSWNTLIAGFSKQDQMLEALNVFRKMQSEEGVEFSWITITTILPICARLTALANGKEVHAQIIKSEKTPDVFVLNSLIDMYMKCGVFDYGSRLFRSMIIKNLTSWNTMLNGFAINGLMGKAMELFDEMVLCGVRPDKVTFIALLSGCSHAGLTEDGKTLFDNMETHFGVSPCLEHYACLVDIMGRAGRIEEAMEIVKNMPMKPSASIWGSLLNSCHLRGDVSIAEAAAEKLFELEPNNPGNYVLLSNIYANAGMWESVNKVRERMQVRGIKKNVGCSWVQLKNKVHSFVASGGSQFRNSAEYKKMWSELTRAMEENGYVPNTSVVLHDVNDEMKAMWVCGHSERLATMFSLINTSSGMPIRITKNLRVCRDCHSWIKVVSRVTGRMIVVRDTNRFHHFNDGECSCKDYW